MVKLNNSLLRAPRVFAHMAIVAVVTAIVTYIYTGSFTTSAMYGGMAIILQQVGYIGGILFLAWREHTKRRR